MNNINQLDINKLYTFKDYLSWQFKTRVELIKGRIYKMSPAPSPRHQEVLSALNAELHQFLKAKNCKVFPAPFDVRLDIDKGTVHTVVQPDLSVVCDMSKIDDKGCNGAPDLVVEIISPSTAKKDLHEKYDLYERSGIHEYWIIHPFERTLSVFVLSKGSYVTSKPMTEGDIVQSTILPGFKLNLNDIFPARVEEPDEEYRRI
ncbi:Uma2 family endonuclease [Carboxylicivirga sp. M1479]|uniref:Uma2 family endonuclease n=1 Tax=Carboxylicivirga sp. M1479 TaxID=2594476 RepID=UPI0011775840|nr:Uma2 family endonuclease [Carboxylicivirga sp. M1479]TRX70535.1 Uma2 family endonuclease [Carboxylicivirga sp. M1479]